MRSKSVEHTTLNGHGMTALSSSVVRATRLDSLEPILVRLPEAQRISGLSRSEIYRRAGRPEGDPGRIILRKCGASTLVDVPSLKAAIASLPAASIRPQAA